MIGAVESKVDRLFEANQKATFSVFLQAKANSRKIDSLIPSMVGGTT